MKPELNEGKPFFPWIKERLVGQKAPLTLKEIWAIRIRGYSYLKKCGIWRYST